MNKKIIPITISLVFCSGFFLGRFSANKKSKVVETTKTAQISTTTQNEQKHVETQKDSMVSQQTVKVVNYYRHTGKVWKSEYVEKNMGSKTLVDSRMNVNTRIAEQVKTQSEQKVITTYQPNWMLLGGYEPSLSCLTQFCLGNLMVGGGYRLIDGFYVLGEVSGNFKQYYAKIAYTF